ncbi:hypothetical protein [Paenibacillus sp. EZ-K15]|nr:hypothetical protein [Paenibacillus sp. EZ-K15]
MRIINWNMACGIRSQAKPGIYAPKKQVRPQANLLRFMLQSY